MSTNLYEVSPGNAANAQDLNQLVAALSGQNDMAVAALYQPLANPPALTATVGSGSGALNGAYSYVVAYLTGWMDGYGTIHYSGNQTAGGQPSNVVNPANQPVDLTNIPIGPAGVVARVLYRTTAGGSTYYYLATIADNVTTEYTDNTADANLGTQTAPTVNTTGTVLQLPVFPSVPGFTAPAGVIIAVQPSGDPVTLYRSTGSGWLQIPDLATANTWDAQQTVPDLAVSGLTGATTASRYVGGTSGGPPTTGTFAVGDFVVDATSQTLWLCTVAGTPGTWVKASPSTATTTTPGIVTITVAPASGAPTVYTVNDSRVNALLNPLSYAGLF